MKIEVLSVRLFPGHKTTRAFIDIRLDDVVIKDFRVIQNGGKPYVKAPFTTYKNQSGELCFRQIIDLPLMVQAEVNALILEAFFRRTREQSHGQSQ
jgi:DNA-binding cell septation regulator SpoVG